MYMYFKGSGSGVGGTRVVKEGSPKVAVIRGISSYVIPSAGFVPRRLPNGSVINASMGEKVRMANPFVLFRFEGRAIKAKSNLLSISRSWSGLIITMFSP